MTVTVAIRGESGTIHRFQVFALGDDLPKEAGIYCLSRPVGWAGADLTPLFWGASRQNLHEEIRTEGQLRDAVLEGATVIAFSPCRGRRARQRHLEDLRDTLPAEMEARAEDAPRALRARRYSRAG